MTGAAGARRSLLWPRLVALAGIVVLIGLGTWQMQRHEWKTALIAEIDQRRVAPALESLPATVEPTLEFRQVALVGRFLHDKEMRLISRSRGGVVGLELVTPLALADGTTVLVNRGWVPGSLADAAKRPDTLVSGEVQVRGAVRLGERLGWATPENRPAEGLWFSVDLAAMASDSGISALPYIVVIEGAGLELPRPRQPGALPKNDHLQYALTWYALAAALGVIAVLAARQARR
ncbi:MAG: SURF1 family protein [Alphaproteobacteria bacterium]